VVNEEAKAGIEVERDRQQTITTVQEKKAQKQSSSNATILRALQHHHGDPNRAQNDRSIAT
jgi:hypothetical protein